MFMVLSQGGKHMQSKSSVFWFITGSQHLYGPETLKEVNAHSQIIADWLDQNSFSHCKVLFKPVLTTPEEIRSLCMQANNDSTCAGLITWMHTLTQNVISGLPTKQAAAHLHPVQPGYSVGTIDMDFMNLNQSAMVTENMNIGALCACPARLSWVSEAIRLQ